MVKASFSNDSFTYNGQAQAPTCTLSGLDAADANMIKAVLTYEGSGTTVYAATSTAPTNAGTYKVTCSGITDSSQGKVTALSDDLLDTLNDATSKYTFAGTSSKTFTIEKKDITGANVVLDGELTENGSEQTQLVKSVTCADGMDIPLSELDITGNTATCAGNYTMSIAAKADSNFTGTLSVNFTVKSSGEPTPTPTPTPDPDPEPTPTPTPTPDPEPTPTPDPSPTPTPDDSTKTVDLSNTTQTSATDTTSSATLAKTGDATPIIALTLVTCSTLALVLIARKRLS